MNKKIKSQAIYRVDHLPGEEELSGHGEGTPQSYQEFDETGNILKEVTFTPDGEIADKNVYRYNESGQLVESLIYGQDDEILEKVEAIRSPEGLLVRELVYYLDGSVDTREYQYNDQGQVTGMVVKDDEGSLEYLEKYYFEGDMPVKVERYQDRDELVFSQEDIYEHGRITSRKIWSNEAEEAFTLVQQFNSAGRKEMELRYNHRDQVIERNVYEEDEHGRMLRIVEENKQRKNTTEFKYDEQGRMIHQAETDLNGRLNHQVSRVYDDEGILMKVTVEQPNRVTGGMQAYSLVYRYETYDH